MGNLGCVKSQRGAARQQKVMEKMKIQKSNSQTIEFQRLTQKYKFTKEQIGCGQSGTVHLAESVADPNFKVAIKLIPKSKVIS